MTARETRDEGEIIIIKNTQYSVIIIILIIFRIENFNNQNFTS